MLVVYQPFLRVTVKPRSTRSWLRDFQVATALLPSTHACFHVKNCCCIKNNYGLDTLIRVFIDIAVVLIKIISLQDSQFYQSDHH